MNVFFELARFLSVAPLKTTFAYLDPGSGSFILQILIAALVGGAFIIKTYWKKITSFFGRMLNRRQDGEDQ